MSTFNNDLFGICGVIKNAHHDLRSLANAFERTGNTSAAEELHTIAETVHDAQSAILNRWTEHLSGELRESQEGMARTLKVLLDGPGGKP